MGQETLNAIKEFQNQHKDSLTVDGLVGDKTASALGISNLGDSSLTATRKGQYQGRKAPGEISGVSAAENAKMRDYYNSPEMWNYLANHHIYTGADRQIDFEYYNHYQNALKYLPPAKAAILRASNDEGDAYDEDVQKQNREAAARHTGIYNFKQDLASGALKLTSDNLKQYAKKYHLSVEEINELLADPERLNAMNVAATRADNGRVNSRAARTQREVDDISRQTSDIGLNYVLPVIASYPTAVAAPLATMGSVLGGSTTNNLVRNFSNGQYNTWGAMMADKTNTPDKQWAWEFTNAGALAGGAIGGAIEGFAPATGAQYSKTTIANPKYVKGVTHPVKAHTRTITTGYEPQLLINMETQGLTQKPIRTTVNIPAHNASYPKTLTRTVQTQKATPASLDPSFSDVWQTNIKHQGVTPEILELPTYDTFVTYGPYNNINRVAFKQGGSLNYLNYIK